MQPRHTTDSIYNSSGFITHAQERWLFVKHEEQEAMLMDKLCPRDKARSWDPNLKQKYSIQSSYSL